MVLSHLCLLLDRGGEEDCCCGQGNPKDPSPAEKEGTKGNKNSTPRSVAHLHQTAGARQ